ncbi:MAG: HEPN domain-containing protein [Bacteroidaceae bacterium]|nr:HEPN domain-containing protein [Bacteroidaceae bacterium]
MANEERATKWLAIVAEDLSVAEDLYKTKHWLYVAFMCHQVVEKVLKAYWCVCRDDDPPFIHDHKRIAEGCGLYTKMSDEQKEFLTQIRQMNIAARYQEYKDELATSLNSEIAKNILETTKQMHAWMLQKFSEKTKL